MPGLGRMWECKGSSTAKAVDILGWWGVADRECKVAWLGTLTPSLPSLVQKRRRGCPSWLGHNVDHFQWVCMYHMTGGGILVN